MSISTQSEIDLRGRKSVLAKLLAGENITVRHVSGADTAHFNGKTRVVVLPIWKNMSSDLYDLLVGHEVAHALYTPAWTEALTEMADRLSKETGKKITSTKIHPYLNVIEDARIDKLQRRRYPGLRIPYAEGYKELHEKDFFGTKSTDFTELKARPFIDRINLYFKMHPTVEMTFSPKEKEFILRISKAERFTEVLSLVEELVKEVVENSIEITVPSQEKGEDQSGSGEGEKKEESQAADEAGGEESSNKAFSEDASKSGDPSEEEESDGVGGSFEKDDTEGEDEGTSSDDGDDDLESATEALRDQMEKQDDFDLPEVQTAESLEKNLKDLTASDFDQVYLEIPKFLNPSTQIHDYKTVLEMRSYMETVWWAKDFYAESVTKLQEFMNSEKATLAYMIKEFEQKKAASLFVRQQISKTGKLDLRKLHSYKFSEDIFQKITKTPKGKNHGFFMLLDWSGSMASILRDTVKQLLLVTAFCRRVGIPFEVYSFGDLPQGGRYSVRSGGSYYDTNLRLFFSEVPLLRNILSSRMTNTEYQKASQYLYALGDGLVRQISTASSEPGVKFDAFTGTPLTPSVYLSKNLVKEFRDRNRIEILTYLILSDGEDLSTPLYDRTEDSISKNFGKRKISTVVVDSETKREYSISPKYGNVGYYPDLGRSDDQLRIALQNLRDSVPNIHLIGYRVLERSRGSILNQLSQFVDNIHDETQKKNVRDSWNDEQFIVASVKSKNSYISVFDAFYVVSKQKLHVNNSQFKVDSSKKITSKNIAKNFANHSMARRTSRVMVANFIDRISRNFH